MSMQQNSFQQNAFQIGAATGAPAVDIGWFEPLSNIKRPRTTSRAAPRQAVFFDPLPQPPPMGWFQPLAVPQRRNAKLKALNDRNNSGNTYLTPVSEPTLVSVTTSYQGPTFTRVTRYQSMAFVPDLAPAVETVTVDKWFTPFTDPKRVRPHRPPAPVDLALDPFPVVSFSWFHPWPHCAAGLFRRKTSPILIRFQFRNRWISSWPGSAPCLIPCG
jgi:hypothetical protein